MPDPTQNAILKELTDLIEKERNHDKFTKSIAELNAPPGEQKKPPANRQPNSLLSSFYVVNRSRDQGDESK